MDNFQFDLVSPEKLLFSGQVQGVVIPGTEGDFEVLAHHAPVMSTIRPGIITVIETAAGTQRRIFVRGGFADVSPQGLTILADSAVAFEDLSAEKLAKEVALAESVAAAASSDMAKARAEEKLDQIKLLKDEIAR